MNVQCVLCKEIVDIGDFRSSARGIEITCLACGETYEVEAPGGAAPAERQPGDGERACPKCGAANRADAAACARCGLSADRFDGFEADRADQVPDALRELWQGCVDDWDDPTAHDRFVASAVAADAYGYAAGRYRGALRERPDDRIAGRRLAEIRRRAEAAILETAAARRYDEPAKEPYRAVALMLAVLVAIAAVGAVYAVFLRDGAQASAVDPGPAKVRAVPTRRGD